MPRRPWSRSGDTTERSVNTDRSTGARSNRPYVLDSSSDAARGEQSGVTMLQNPLRERLAMGVVATEHLRGRASEVYLSHVIMGNPRLCRGLPQFASSGRLPFAVFSGVGFDCTLVVRPLCVASNRPTSSSAGGDVFQKMVSSADCYNDLAGQTISPATWNTGDAP